MTSSPGVGTSVTISSLLEHELPLSWQEAVAVVLELAEMLERLGRPGMPHHEDILLTQPGGVELRGERTQSGETITALLALLSDLLPTDRPVQLRLALSTAEQQGATAYASVRGFIDQLAYFERPDRQDLLAELHKRALVPRRPVPRPQPLPDSVEPERLPWRARLLRIALPVVAVAVVAAAAVLGAALIERQQPGLLRARATSLQHMTSTAIRRLIESTTPVRDKSLLTVTEEETGSVSPDAAPTATDDASGSGSTAATGVVAVHDARAALPEDVAPRALADKVVSEPRKFSDAAGGATIFDIYDEAVTPPVALHKLPSFLQDAQSQNSRGAVDALVSPTGEVEKVKLLPPPYSIHQSMSLSAIKTWRFRPATKDGSAVWYRLRLNLVGRDR